MSPEQEAQLVEGLKQAGNGQVQNADRIWHDAIAAAAKDDAAVAADMAAHVASLAANVGLLDQAYAYERLYLDISKKLAAPDPALEMLVANAIGAKLLDDQQPAAAEPYYRRAVVAARLTGDEALIALHTGNLASLLLNSGKAADSIPFFQSAIKSYEKCGDTDWQICMLTSLGNAQRETGDADSALVSYQSAVKLSSSSKDRGLQGTVLDNLASAKAKAGDMSLAVALREEAVKFALLADDSALQKRCEGNLVQDLLRVFPKEEVPAWFAISRGKAQLDLEDHAGAEHFFRQAVGEAQKTSNPRLHAAAYRWLADELIRNQNLAEAEQMLWMKVEAASTAGDAETVMQAYGKVATLLMRRGEYALALRCWTLQDVQAEHQGLSLETAIDRTEAFIELGNWRAAERLLRRCEEALAQTKDQTLSARSERAWGEVALLRGNLKEADTHLTKALAQSAVGCDAPAVMDVALSMGRWFAAEGRFEGARGHATEVSDWAARTGDKTREIAAGCLLGQALLADGSFKDAFDKYSSAAVTAKALDHKPYWGLALAGAAESCMWLSDFDTAHTLLQAAIGMQRGMAQGLDDENSIALLRQQERTYELFQSCLVAKGRSDEALLAGERLKANALAHVLEQRYGPGAGARAMKATFQDAALEALAADDVGRGHKEPGLQMNRGFILRTLGMTALREVQLPELTIADIQALCRDENMTIVSYSWLESGELYAWVVSSDALQFQPLLTSDNQSLDDVIERLRATLRVQRRDSFLPTLPQAEDEAAIRQVCRDLYRILIAPLAQFLPKGNGALVGIVPSGTLFRVPFPALSNDSGTALIDLFGLVVAPSIRFFRQSESLGSAGPQAVVVGNPAMPDLHAWASTSEASLPALPASEDEAAQVCRTLTAKGLQPLPLTGKAASKKAFLEALKAASLAHVATHSLLDEQYPNHSAIALAPEADDNGFLTATDISRLDVRLDLAVLSACSTGVGEVSGDGVSGLARAWHVAGARSVVYSLWSVHDDATSWFMQSFYQAAVQDGNYAQAMQAACIEARKRFTNPLDWAGFALSGQARSKMTTSSPPLIDPTHAIG
jgi:CHAT domain-containing protein/tetratricopeptide (TPR) repeat protein